ncbi:MAG: hypothetical protein Q8O82_01970 [Pseudorhodobacter sp.]|nr:hypothetical protein [Pseudorhodobacter sp.]
MMVRDFCAKISRLQIGNRLISLAINSDGFQVSQTFDKFSLMTDSSCIGPDRTGEGDGDSDPGQPTHGNRNGPVDAVVDNQDNSTVEPSHHIAPCHDPAKTISVKYQIYTSVHPHFWFTQASVRPTGCKLSVVHWPGSFL